MRGTSLRRYVYEGDIFEGICVWGGTSLRGYVYEGDIFERISV